MCHEQEKKKKKEKKEKKEEKEEAKEASPPPKAQEKPKLVGNVFSLFSQQQIAEFKEVSVWMEFSMEISIFCSTFCVLFCTF